MNASICIEEFCDSLDDIAAFRDIKTSAGLEINAAALAVTGFTRRDWQHATRDDFIQRLAFSIRPEYLAAVSAADAAARNGKTSTYKIKQQNYKGHLIQLSANVQPVYSSTHKKKVIAAFSRCSYAQSTPEQLIARYESYFSNDSPAFYMPWLVDQLGIAQYFITTPTLAALKWLIYSDYRISRVQLAEKLGCSIDMLGYYAQKIKNGLRAGYELNSVREHLRTKTK